MSTSDALSDFRKLLRSSAVYGMGIVAIKGISFFLVPFYTRFLTPTDYGIVSLATAIIAVLSVVITLSLHSYITRLYFDVQSEIVRRQKLGTMWLFTLLFGGMLAIVLDRFGVYIFQFLVPDIPFDPYVRMAIWIAYLNACNLMPLTLLQVQERPKLYVLFIISGTLLNIGLVTVFVIALKLGAYGYLLGTLLSSATMFIFYVSIMWKASRFTWQFDLLWTAFVYSIPLVPHLIASWVLELSDRIILANFVSLAEVGIYSLGYQLGAVVAIAASALNQAWVPYVFRIVADEADAAKPKLARLTTYYCLMISAIALSAGLLLREILVLLAAPTFQASYPIVVWVIVGQWLSGLYYIPVNFLFLRDKTRIIPIITISAGLLNIGLNLWWVPIYGIIGAAWATAGSYAIMLGLVCFISLQVYSLKYEYRRLLMAVGVAAALLFTGYIIASPEQIALSILMKFCLIWAYPVILVLARFVTMDEREQLHQLWLHKRPAFLTSKG